MHPGLNGLKTWMLRVPQTSPNIPKQIDQRTLCCGKFDIEPCSKCLVSWHQIRKCVDAGDAGALTFCLRRRTQVLLTPL